MIERSVYQETEEQRESFIAKCEVERIRDLNVKNVKNTLCIGDFAINGADNSIAIGQNYKRITITTEKGEIALGPSVSIIPNNENTIFDWIL